MEDRKHELISMLRSQCRSKGYGGFKGLGLIFRRLDRDYSKRITFPELYHGVRSYGLNISNADFRLLFDALDKDGSGEIDFREFMQELRGPLAECRKSVIREAFDKIDVNGDGIISIEDLKVVYSEKAQEHPRYKSGEWTLDDTLRYFLDALDTPGCPDGKVTWEEFLIFYSGVSATVDDDCYFDLLMRACYDLPRGWPHGTAWYSMK